MRILAFLFAAASPAIFAQSSSKLPGCEPRPEVQQMLDEKLSETVLEKMKPGARLAHQRQVLEELIAQYPREVEPQRRLIELTLQDDTAQFPALVNRYREQAEQHGGDPLALYLAGVALFQRDTPLSVRFLEQARSLAPHFAWPALNLARIYQPGSKHADKAKAGESIAAFFAECPSSTDALAQRMLGRTGSGELQKRVPTALRARLSGETDPHRLMDYEILWGLEFRAHPTPEHAALRAQIAGDVKRLESLNSKPNAQWLALLKNGYKQSGATPETLAAMEDRLIQAFPRCDQAYQILRERWDLANKEPEDQKDAAAWTKYNAAYGAALKGWMDKFPESGQLRDEWFAFLAFHEPDLPPDEGLRAFDQYLAEFADYPPTIGFRLRTAGFLIKHNWQPRRAVELLRDSDQLVDQWYARVAGDNLSAESEDIWLNNAVAQRQAATGYALKAARMAEQPSEGARRKVFIERDLAPGTWASIETWYWVNRGRLAWLEDRKPDALTYYQKALFARKRAPDPFEGRVVDDLMDDARLLWQSLGGTEKAWKIWSTPPAASIRQAADSGWKKPAKDMPAFELADLAGKTWRLRDLAGRAVLINVWATWCGPCQAELPKLEKLYEKVKDRSDVQILTLTIDEDLGAVAPFMKEKGYTFPVLPAFSFVTGLLDLVAIPQNWIVDGKGVWRWTGAPDAPDAEWGEAMLKQIESAK